MKRIIPWLVLPLIAIVGMRAYFLMTPAQKVAADAPAARAAHNPGVQVAVAQAPVAKTSVANASVAAVPSGKNWSHWRGPEENGVSRERDLPLKWSDKLDGLGENVLWKSPYGTRSTPIVQNGRVYIVNDVDSGINEQERICCLDAKSGKLLWERRFNVFLVDIVSSRVGWTSMAGDPETGYVYCHGTQGYITCLDKDGKQIWQRSLTEEVGRFCGYGGRLSSPVVDGDLVMTGIINANYGDQAKGANRFFAFDKRTGQTVWWADTHEKVNDTYYSTPIVANIAGERLLICGGGDGFLDAFKVRTGEVAWNFPVSVKAINSSPVVWGNKVYIGNGEENADDPSIQGQVVCVDGADVKDHHPKLVWKADAIRAAFGSPTIYDGKLYMPEESGKLFCF
ncbi:MAG TPA: PQQ-binding-like beta-propeller repeat protein, partial [Gemmataceae bacterium]|nr:PQQ-binding-like beta-propeller repeat protein [Gemmataceae bacterium]